MQKLLSFIKNTLHTTFGLVVAFAVVIYVAVHFNLTGMLVNHNLTERLSEKLNARVEVEDIEVNWLNQVALNHIVIFDQNNDTMLYARRAMVAYEFFPLLQQKLVLNTIQLIDFNFNIRKATPEADPNFLFMVEALAPRRDDSRRQFINDATINALFLRQGTITYDVLDQPRNTVVQLIDPNHVSISDISASMKINISHISGLDITLNRMHFKESEGLDIYECEFDMVANNSLVDIKGFSIKGSKRLNSKELMVSASADASYCNDSLKITSSNFSLDSDNLLRLSGCANAFLDVHKTDSLTLASKINHSYIKAEALKEILLLSEKFTGTQLEILGDSIESVSVDGTIELKNNHEVAFDGNIGTSGLISSQFASKINYGDVISAQVDGKLKTLPYNNYTYSDIALKANLNGNRIHASYRINDANCKANGTADVSLKDSIAKLALQASVRSIMPHKLNLTQAQNFKGLDISGEIKADMTANLDLLQSQQNFTADMMPLGFAKMEQICLRKDADTLRLDPIRINIQKEQGTLVGVLTSPILNAVATPSALIGVIPAHKEFAEIMSLGGYLTEPANFTAEWDSTDCVINVEANFPSVAYGDAVINASVSANGTTVKGNPVPDYLTSRLNLNYKTEKHELSTKLRAAIEPDPLYIVLEPSKITIDGRDFETTGAQLSKERNGSLTLQDMHIQDKEQSLEISGVFVDGNDLDFLIQTNHVQTDFFFDMLGKNYLDFGGFATGDIIISSDSILHLATDSLVLDEFSYIENPLGKHYVTCFYDLINSRLQLDTHINTDSIHDTHAVCDIMMGVEDSLDLRFAADHLPIDFVSYWTGGVLQDMHGQASGDVRLFGKFSDLNITGHPELHDVSFTHDLLGARFLLSDTLHMEVDSTETKGYIGLNKAKVRDIYGQEALVTVDLEHRHFSNMEYGVDIDLPDNSNGFLIFDHPNQVQNELYWGRLWATGRCQMHGTYDTHKINLQMATAGRSVFNLSPGEENFSENKYNFLTFRDKRFLGLEEDNLYISGLHLDTPKTESSTTFIDADLQIHANEHCQVFVQMDPLAEDRLICRGNGDLALHYDPYHDITLTGNYDINQGSYTVNMKGDLMTKAFALQEGSRVTFSGVPSEAELNLNATYNIPSANLRDLDESFASLSSLSRTTLPVDCKLLVNGQITAPQISFDLEIKNTSDDVQALVHNIIGTQEMLNREVFYLLLFSKFYTPEYASTSQRQTGSELTSFASSSLTSQLNNLLGHMSDNFTLGTNFRSDKGDFSDMEMDVSLSTRLLNDRLLLNGNLGYRDPANRIGLANNNSSFIGDFDMEYLINTSGTVRAKVYSHYNDRDYSINNALTTQGAGIILRKDFKSFRNLLQWHR